MATRKEKYRRQQAQLKKKFSLIMIALLLILQSFSGIVPTSYSQATGDEASIEIASGEDVETNEGSAETNGSEGIEADSSSSETDGNEGTDLQEDEGSASTEADSVSSETDGNEGADSQEVEGDPSSEDSAGTGTDGASDEGGSGLTGTVEGIESEVDEATDEDSASIEADENKDKEEISENTEAELVVEDEEGKEEAAEEKQKPEFPVMMKPMTLFAPMGAAAPISENIITGVNLWNKVPYDGDGSAKKLEDIRPEVGDLVVLYYDWKLAEGHSYGAGSTYQFNLPTEFKTATELSGDLTGEVGKVGEYIVTPSGQVTFTFNDSIDNETGLEGNFYVWRSFDESQLASSTKHEIQFADQAATKITIHFKSEATNAIVKNGIKDKPMNPSKIDWVVDFNIGEEPIDDAVFTDVIPVGLNIDMSSIEVTELIVKLDGSVTEGGTFNNYTSDNLGPGAGFELTFTDPTITKAYRVKYATTVDPIITTPYNKDHENKATVSGTNITTMEAIKKLNVSFSRPLAKASTGYDSPTQTITWKIQYNYNEQTIARADAWVEDAINPTGTAASLLQELVDTNPANPGSFEVYEMTIDDNGNSTRTTGTPLVYGVDYTVDDSFSDGAYGEGFKIEFTNEITSAYEIIYKTKAKERIYADSATITNKARMTGAIETEATRSINQVIFTKDDGVINYNSKEITWTITLNEDKNEMKDVIITDTFGEGMTLDENSLKASLAANGFTEDYYTLVGNPDYNSGFIITFIGGTTITDKHIITYKTKIEPTDYSAAVIKTKAYANTGTLNWCEDNGGGCVAQTEISKTGTRNLNNDTKNNGSKTMRGYNAQTKEISWELDVNYNRHTINGAIVEDIYIADITKENQTFLPASLAVHKLTIATGGGKSLGAPHPINTTDTDKFEYILNGDGNIIGFKIKLGDITDAYRITYKTSLVNHAVIGPYANKATLYATSTPETKLFNETASVSPKHGGEFVAKTGQQGTGADALFANWTVNINRSQSFIAANSSLTDTLSVGQTLISGSFKLYETDVAVNGTVTKKAGPVFVDPAAYTLAVTGNTFTLTFNNDLHTAYILEYQSFIDADDGENISNNITFAGQSAGVVNENKNSNILVNFAGAGGGAVTAGKGTITILKEDASNSSKKLAGAVFEIYNKARTLKVDGPLTTDADGKIVSKKLNYADYSIKEVGAPPGYKIDTEWTDIKLNKADQNATIKNTEIKQGLELTKLANKTIQGGLINQPLAEVVYKLQMKDGAEYKDVLGQTNLITNAQGKIALADLAAGDYQLIETVPVKGYILDPTPIPFTIVQNQTAVLTKTVTNTLIEDGSLELTKVDAFDNAAIENAEFELQDDEGNVLQTGLKTDATGKLVLTNLIGGSYQIVETKAAEFYKLNTAPITFEIIDGAKDSKITFANDLKTCGVQLNSVRLNNETTKLKGAEFKIVDENGNVVKDKNGNNLEQLITDVDGKLIVTDLRPGKYQFIQTNAPTGGYVLNKTPIDFEIPKVSVTCTPTEVKVTNAARTSSGGGGSYVPPLPKPPTEELKKPEENNPIEEKQPEKENLPENEKPKELVPNKPIEENTGGNNSNVADATEGNTNDDVSGGTVLSSSNKKPSISSNSSAQATKNRSFVNGKWVELPKTGEEAKTGLYIVGAISLIIGASLLFFKRRRKIKI